MLAKRSNGGKKDKGDDLFDLLDTSKLNAHLKELMPGLTAKVFRTYNASITLDVIVSVKTEIIVYVDFQSLCMRKVSQSPSAIFFNLL